MKYEDIVVGQYYWINGVHIRQTRGDDYAVKVHAKQMNVHNSPIIDIEYGGLRYPSRPEWLHEVGGSLKSSVVEDHRPEAHQAALVKNYRVGWEDGVQSRDSAWAQTLASVVPEGVDPMNPEAVYAFITELRDNTAAEKVLECIASLVCGGYTVTKETTSDEWEVISLLIPDRNVKIDDTVHLDVHGDSRSRPGSPVPNGFTFPSGSTVTMTGCTTTSPNAQGTRLHELMERFVTQSHRMSNAEMDELYHLLKPMPANTLQKFLDFRLGRAPF